MNATLKFLLPLALLLASVEARAQANKIVVTGGSGLEVPIKDGTVVEFQSNGDLRVECAPNCPVAGGGTSGDRPTVTFSAPANGTAVASGGTVNLQWSSTNALVCLTSASPAVPNWAGLALLPSTTARSFAMPSVTAQTSYTLTLACYNAAGSNVVAATRSITVNAPTSGGGGTGSAYCDEYYPTKPAIGNFNAWGFTRVDNTIQGVWGVATGASAPLRGVPGSYLSPINNRYLAVAFTMPSAGETMRLTWAENQTPDTSGGPISISISPCPGDFRGVDQAPAFAGDLYSGPACRSGSLTNLGSLDISGTNIGGNSCYAPPGKLMYINMTPYAMGGTVAPTVNTCHGEPHCGVQMQIE